MRGSASAAGSKRPISPADCSTAGVAVSMWLWLWLQQRLNLVLAGVAACALIAARLQTRYLLVARATADAGLKAAGAKQGWSFALRLTAGSSYMYDLAVNMGAPCLGVHTVLAVAVQEVMCTEASTGHQKRP